jgi:uncharacterized repeat protein (TIGR01451 family)
MIIVQYIAYKRKKRAGRSPFTAGVSAALDSPRCLALCLALALLNAAPTPAALADTAPASGAASPLADAPHTDAALPAGIRIRTVAEVETRALINGREAIKLRPAERVVPGDQILYTLEIRNVGPTPLRHPSVPFPIPEHMSYIEDSAIGPGARVDFSVDGGHTFQPAPELKVAGPRGTLRAARATDYTHIRWQFRQTLEPNSVAFARFRALVK